MSTEIRRRPEMTAFSSVVPVYVQQAYENEDDKTILDANNQMLI